MDEATKATILRGVTQAVGLAIQSAQARGVAYEAAREAAMAALARSDAILADIKARNHEDPAKQR